MGAFIQTPICTYKNFGCILLSPKLQGPTKQMSLHMCIIAPRCERAHETAAYTKAQTAKWAKTNKTARIINDSRMTAPVIAEAVPLGTDGVRTAVIIQYNAMFHLFCVHFGLNFSFTTIGCTAYWHAYLAFVTSGRNSTVNSRGGYDGLMQSCNTLR